MKWLIRPWVLLLISAGLAVGALLLPALWWTEPNEPNPLPVAPGQHEVVWLDSTTNLTGWRQLVDGLKLLFKAEERSIFVDDRAAFPVQTTDVPELVLKLPNSDQRLVFRQYPLTSDWNSERWIGALMRRSPPPLAIIGGSFTDQARELARQLARQTRNLPREQHPVLVLPTATADRVLREGEVYGAEETVGEGLTEIYPQRTYRFCFSNQQMARAILNHIRNQADLRPDTELIHFVGWNDDRYSRDLTDAFSWEFQAPRQLWQVARDLLLLADRSTLAVGAGAAGVVPVLAASLLTATPGWALRRDGRPLEALPFASPIETSIGGFSSPNRYETEVAGDVAGNLAGDQGQKRPLLVVTGQ